MLTMKTEAEMTGRRGEKGIEVSYLLCTNVNFSSLLKKENFELNFWYFDIGFLFVIILIQYSEIFLISSPSVHML